MSRGAPWDVARSSISFSTQAAASIGVDARACLPHYRVIYTPPRVFVLCDARQAARGKDLAQRHLIHKVFFPHIDATSISHSVRRHHPKRYPRLSIMKFSGFLSYSGGGTHGQKSTFFFQLLFSSVLRRIGVSSGSAKLAAAAPSRCHYLGPRTTPALLESCLPRPCTYR